MRVKSLAVLHPHVCPCRPTPAGVCFSCRAEEIGGRLGHFFEQRRRLKTSDAEPKYPQEYFCWSSMSAWSRGCAKTRSSQRCTELFSQLPSSDRSCQRNWFPHRRNRDGNSTRKLNVGVFTQPRSDPGPRGASKLGPFITSTTDIVAISACPFRPGRDMTLGPSGYVV
jgi:hypothetical protein